MAKRNTVVIALRLGSGLLSTVTGSYGAVRDVMTAKMHATVQTRVQAFGPTLNASLFRVVVETGVVGTVSTRGAPGRRGS
jgi:hypothetical protein